MGEGGALARGCDDDGGGPPGQVARDEEAVVVRGAAEGNEAPSTGDRGVTGRGAMRKGRGRAKGRVILSKRLPECGNLDYHAFQRQSIFPLKRQSKQSK